MRTRTRSTTIRIVNVPAGSVNVSFTPCTGAPSVTPLTRGAYDIRTQFIDERITDATGKGQSHHCQHYKRTRIVNPGGGVFIQGATGPGGAAGVAIEPRAGFEEVVHSSVHDGMVGNWFSLGADPTGYPKGWSCNTGSVNESLMMNQVLESANQLKADVLLNIVEANQILPSIKSLSTELPKLRKNWNAIRKAVRTSAGTYLAWKFGIAPIISDMVAIHKFVPKMAQDLRRHKDGDHRRFSIATEVPMTYTSQAPAPDYLNGVPYWQYGAYGRILSPPKLRYVLVVKPAVEYSSDLFTKADHFMRRFATSPASLAWEKVPFSFVVDWFVDLSGMLRVLDKSLGFSPYKIISFTRSFSYNVSTETQLIRLSPCDSHSLFGGLIGYEEYKAYERSLASPYGILPQWKPHFGKNQAGISAALIAQALSKLRR